MSTTLRLVGGHEVECEECACTWFCECGSAVLHAYLTGGENFCPLCRPAEAARQREAYRARDNFATESNLDKDANDPSLWPDATAAWRKGDPR